MARLIRDVMVVFAIAFIVTVLALSPSAAQSDCQARCDDNYYLCLRGGASVGERACSTSRSTCSMTCGTARKNYGAIAYSKMTAAFGFADHHDSKESANRRAIQECTLARPGSNDCEVLVWFYDRCAALALGENKAYGAAHAANLRSASDQALAHCRGRGAATCKIVHEACSLN